MSHFKTENNTLAQQIEGFSNYDCGQSLYELTPALTWLTQNSKS